MTAQQLFTRLATCVLTCIVMAAASLLSAATLTWEGDLGTGWGDGVDGVDTNWSNNSFPTAADDLVFLSTGTYTGNLDLGGNTYAANSITVGDAGSVTVGGLSDFGATNRILGQNGTLDLGAGGMNVVFPLADGTFLPGDRHVTFNNDINVTANSSITRKTNGYASDKKRSLYFGGDISGSSTLDVVNEGAIIWWKSIFFSKNNSITGDMSATGYIYVNGTGDFGSGNNQLTLTDNPSDLTYIANYSTTGTHDNDYVLSPTDNLRLGRFGGADWTITGDVTGGDGSKWLQIYTLGNTRPIIFEGATQDFENYVRILGGSKVIIANSNAGLAWENAAYIRLNDGDYNGSAVTTDLLLRGDHTLNQVITLPNTADTNANINRIGQTNDGVTPSDATFGGRLDIQETDYQVLNLTADAGGSATFTGEININSTGGLGGGFGFDKVGDGTVNINGRVSEDLSNLTPIGAVNVKAGTLRINSPAGTDGFYASSVNVEANAELGGTGQIYGNVVVAVDGSVGPGASIGTLTVDGNVNINGIMASEVNSLSSDLLVVSNTLTLDGASILEITGTPDALTTYILAQAGTVSGTFGSVYFNGDLVPFGEAIGGVHTLLYLNNAVVLQGVPEPSSILLLGMGLCLLARRHGKRRSS